METIIDLVEQLDSFAGFAGVILVVTQFLQGAIFKKAKGFGVQVLAWFTGIGLAFLASWLNIGMFAQLHGQLSELWYVAIVVGFAGGLPANGFADVPKVQDALKAIFKLFGISFDLKKKQ
jgi:hypothetical protein